MAQSEVYRAAFSDPPGTQLAGIPTSNLRLVNPYISYGLPYTEACARHVKDTFKASRVYVIASGTLSRTTSKVDDLVAAIGKDLVVGVRRGMTPHTLWSEILEIVAECKAAKADCVVTLGAGSITDGAKMVVLALANDINDATKLATYSVESTNPPASVKEPNIALITIPTSLSGGEYFSLGGGTDDRTHFKQAFLHSGMGSRLIILDPELCLLTPEYHWLSTGYRSVDHCIEALCSLQATTKSDSDAERGLRLLVPNLLKCKTTQDIESRHHCQMAVILAMGNIRAGIPMGGSHAIGHQLGPLGVPHGVTSCILCPAVMKYNLKYGQKEKQIAERQQKICDILWSEELIANTLTDAGKKRDSTDLGDILDVIIRTLGLPRTLTEMGIEKTQIPALSKRALDDFWAPTNPIPLVKAEQVQEILEAVA